MSWSVLNLGITSNSNHFITCLLIFILHYSPQLGPSLLFNLNKQQFTSSSSSTTSFSSNSTLILHLLQFSNSRSSSFSSYNGAQKQE